MDAEKRIPSLDGIRAAAILLVLYWHVGFTIRGGFPKDGIDWGTLGVYIFFVLSGFLITSMLMRERERTYFISLKNFYTRRFFRILPPVLGLLAGVKILAVLGLAVASDHELFFSLSFLRNYDAGPYRILHHLWSLSVEEQFYLVWPFLFMRLSTRIVSRLLLAIIFIVPVIRLVSLVWAGDKYPWHTEQVADGLAWGCLLAIKQQDLRAWHVYQWFSNSYVPLLLPVAILVGADTTHHKEYALVGKSMIFLCVALGIDVLILRYDSIVGKLANAALVAWLGRLSYSLYLWQQIFLLVRHGQQPYAWFPANACLALLCASVSFYVIEKPTIRLGRSIVARRAQSPVAIEASVITGPGV